MKAFKRGPSLGLSKWYMGMLMTNLAESKDTDEVFFLMEATAVPGTESPPHVGKEAFKVEMGECTFCPKLKPHAFAIRSPRGRVLILVTPGGLEEAFRSESSPAQNLDLPTGAPTYSTTDLKQPVERFGKYGVRFLTQDEVADQLPLYPKPFPWNPGKLTNP